MKREPVFTYFYRSFHFPESPLGKWFHCVVARGTGTIRKGEQNFVSLTSSTVRWSQVWLFTWNMVHVFRSIFYPRERIWFNILSLLQSSMMEIRVYIVAHWHGDAVSIRMVRAIGKYIILIMISLISMKPRRLNKNPFIFDIDFRRSMCTRDGFVWEKL